MNDHVYCGICGHKAVQLYTHIAEAHALSITEYEKRCPKAPLCSEAFLKFTQEHDLQHDGTQLSMNKSLFGLTVPCTLEKRDHVPDADTDYIYDENTGRSLLISLLENDRILLVGHTGCGKSSLISQLGAELNWPVRRVNLDGETSISDFIGQWVVRDKEMTYLYGILPTAMREGQILVLEELDAADPGILFVLQSIMEDGGKLVLTDNGGEIIEPHKDFRLVATANTLGLGDETGLYTGTHVLNQSHLDRWTAVFRMEYLPPSQELEVVRKKVPELKKALAKAIVNLAGAVRRAAEQEQVFCTFSTRKVLAFASKSVSYNSTMAALQITVLNRLSNNDAQVVHELAQRHLPELEKERT
jgi:cobaltochelatase CobS